MTIRKVFVLFVLLIVCPLLLSFTPVVKNPAPDIPEHQAQSSILSFAERPDGRLLLMIAKNQLMQQTQITSQIQERMFFGALGDLRTTNCVLTVHSTDPIQMTSSAEIQLSNTSQIDAEQSRITKVEAIENGTYSISCNEESPQITPNIDADTAQSYYLELLLCGILGPEHIIRGTVTDKATHLSIRYQVDPAFADIITKNICTVLYQDPNVLADQDTEHLVTRLEYTVVMEKETGLPSSLSLTYEGTHTIDHIPYQITYQLTQTYKK